MVRVWTIKERLKQAERIRNQKPWLKSTGPRTVSGKRVSSSNSYKHGSYTTEMKQIFLYLRLQKRYIATLRFLNKQGKLVCLDDEPIFENELNKNPIKSIKNDTNRSVITTYFRQKKTHREGWVFENRVKRPDPTRHQLSFLLPFS
jgi:hypothetical protein